MYLTCPTCQTGDFAADRLLGLTGYITAAARRMAVLLGVQQSFVQAERTLAEVAGWELDDNTLRQLCHATAAQASAQRGTRTTADHFAQATGDLELHMDAGKVNTRQGWRDVKVAVVAKRARGTPCTADTWQERDLPAPAVRSVVAAVEEAQVFGERCVAETRRLGVDSVTPLSVVGDGAAWLWNLADRHWPAARQVLDFWHGVEHLATAATAVGGDGPATQAHLEVGRHLLLADGYAGVTQWVGTLAAQVPAGGEGAALGELLNYFAEHQERLSYAARLRRGQSIGSGVVEGTIKQLLNRRLKQTGARWTVGHVGPLVELGALAAGPEWHAFWDSN